MLCITKIVWNKNEEVYMHNLSGLTYDPKVNRFFTWVGLGPSDLRAVYYEITNGIFALSGGNGYQNRHVLNDQLGPEIHLHGQI